MINIPIRIPSHNTPYGKVDADFLIRDMSLEGAVHLSNELNRFFSFLQKITQNHTSIKYPYCPKSKSGPVGGGRALLTPYMYSRRRNLHNNR